MALRDQPYLPLYVQDIMTDEKLNECSAATHGIYIKGLMCLMHKSEEYGKILLKQKYKQTSKQDVSMSLKFALQLTKHLPYSIDEIKNAIEELIHEEVCYFDGDYLCQKRMIRDNEISEARSLAGKKGGGNPKFVKTKLQTNTQTNTEYEYEYEIEDETEVKGTKKRMTYDDPGFQAFWSVYPKKEAKVLALKAFEKINPDRVLLSQIIGAIEERRKTEQWQKDSGQFIPNPATWLNNRRWEDELEPLTGPSPAEIIL